MPGSLGQGGHCLLPIISEPKIFPIFALQKWLSEGSCSMRIKHFLADAGKRKVRIRPLYTCMYLKSDSVFIQKNTQAL